MPQSEQLEALVLGSGTGGKLIAWHMAQSGRRTGVVERRWVGLLSFSLLTATRRNISATDARR
jgi:choline dehydrogenase-like flavoprotein